MEFLQELKQTYSSGKTKSYDWRRSQLIALRQLLVENEIEIYQALEADLGKCQFESFVTEYAFVLHDIELFLKKLKKWMKPKKVSTPIITQPGKSKLIPEPYGVCLIMGAWNYPIQLVLSPMVAAIGAGNCVVLKPSELSSAVSQLLARLIPKYLDKKAFYVYEGGVEETTELLKQRFDHIMYTGSEVVGKIVMRAASEHLTPVCLELGGKSPCIVDENINLKVAARRIIWGKFLNAGQTCIAPDYILVTPRQREPLLKELEKQLTKQYGQEPINSVDYGRIINHRHFDRLVSYLENMEDKIVVGGQVERDMKFIAPTIVFDPELDSKLMTQEIFGPILPVIEVESIDRAIKFVNEREKPLALYLFSNDDINVRRVTNETSSGTQCINDAVVFMANSKMPFGGVGNSGMGAYHGKWGFDTFSHLKPVMHRSFLADAPIRYPPYSGWKQKLFKWVDKL
jgi:aldehyde dehydrogenase (NAD+)